MMKGSITVFLALSLSVLTGFLLLLTGSAVGNAKKIYFEGAMDLGMNSVLGEFHTGLHDRYGLFYIDLSYDAGEPSLQKLESRLDFFVRKNATEEKDGPWGEVTAKEVKVRQITSAAFDDGNAMKYQAVCYMRDCNRLEFPYGKAWSSIENISSGNAMVQWSGLMGQISEMELPKMQNKEGKWIEIFLENPADAVFELAGHDLFYLSGIDGSRIGVGRIQADNYASRRVLQNTAYGEIKEADTELFVAYLFEKLGNYREIREDSFLQYQLEYVAMGRASDYENMQAVAEVLLQWRFTKNIEFAMGNDKLWDEAFQIADGLQAVTLKEAFRKPVAESMIYALAYLESLAEVRCLFAGGSISIAKESFYTQWEQMHAVSILQIPSASEGFCYEDFLSVMIRQLSDRDRNLRSMDIMEMDIRMISQNPEFAMDFCVERIEAEAEAGSYYLRRTYGYY